MPKRNEKSPVEAATSTEQIEHLPSNSDKETITVNTHLEDFENESATAGNIISEGTFELCADHSWGADIDYAPIWAVDLTDKGMVSDFIEIPAQIYPAAHNKPTGVLRTYLNQKAGNRFPMVHVDIFQDGVNQKACNRTGAQHTALRLFPWEVDALISALRTSRNVAQAYLDTSEKALRASGAFKPLTEES